MARKFSSIRLLAVCLLLAPCAARCNKPGSGVGTFDNPNYTPYVPDPAFPAGEGPLVLLDRAHDNTHSWLNGFAALGELLLAMGFVTGEAIVPVDQLDLSAVGTFIYARPKTYLTESEHDAIATAVCSLGMSFLGVADHSGATGILQVADIAQDFGALVEDTYVVPTEIVFNGSLLGLHPVNTGVSYIRAYDGSSALWVDGIAEPLLVFPEGAHDKAGNSLAGHARAVVGACGAGRWAIVLDVQLLTSKCVGSCAEKVTGFQGSTNGILDAEFDELWGQNLIRWLNHLPPAG